MENRSITDFLGNVLEYKNNCMGCAIINGEIPTPGGFIYEGKYTVLVADPEVPIPGFLVINTKRHVNSFSELTQEEKCEIGEVITYTQKALKQLKIGKEITLVQEERSPHFHIWILTTHEWMAQKFGIGLGYLRQIFEYTKKNATPKEKQEVLDTIEEIKQYFIEQNIAQKIK